MPKLSKGITSLQNSTKECSIGVNNTSNWQENILIQPLEKILKTTIKRRTQENSSKLMGTARDEKFCGHKYL